jgi:hypothetical protein
MNAVHGGRPNGDGYDQAMRQAVLMTPKTSSSAVIRPNDPSSGTPSTVNTNLYGTKV